MWRKAGEEPKDEAELFSLSLPPGWELEQLFKDAPIAELPLQLLASGDLTVEELVVRAGAVPSMCK